MEVLPPLEIKRMKLEIVRVAAARSELEFRIEERLDEIARLKGQIQVQVNRENELKEKITEAEKAR